MSLTAVDEHNFKDYCLKGIGRIVKSGEIDLTRNPQLMHGITEKWNDHISARITSRILKNISGNVPHSSHHEAKLPRPKYMIVLTVKDIVDLLPN